MALVICHEGTDHLMKTYEFDTFKDFFEFHLREKSTDEQGRKKTTLNELATKLGYSSPSSLSMVASGERLPSPALLESLLNAWQISKTEQKKVKLQVEIEKRSRQGKNHSHLVSRFNQLTPFHKIDLKYYNLVRDWYVLVIKVLASCSDFNENPIAISQKLRKKVSVFNVKKSLDLLIETGMLVRDPNTQKLKPSVNLTETSHELASEAIRENHKGMIQRAYEAVEEQTVEQRHFNSLTLQFDMAQIPEAKKRILDFVKNFNAEFNSNKSIQVYQLNVQLFEHSNGGNKNDH